LKAWKYVKAKSALYISQYPTTLDEDLELLKDETLSFNKRNCLLIRKSEKSILNYLIFCANKVAELGKLSKKDA
jgi:hypothetical protein